MNTTANPIYCADVIARYGGPYIVIVERLHAVKGLALPGGRQELGETLTQTAQREFSEETGFELIITEVLGTRGEKGRDPRGAHISTIFIGDAYGAPREEPGKTRVLLMNFQMFQENRSRFSFDHADIIDEYYGLMSRRE